MIKINKVDKTPKLFNPSKYIELHPELDTSVLTSENINEKFEVAFKRPHRLLDKEGKVKFDGRFKLYKKLKSNIDVSEEILELGESVKKFLKNNPELRELGTDSLIDIYKKETPGEQ